MMLYRRSMILMICLALVPACTSQFDGPNLDPMALAGPDQMVLTGGRVLLDAAGSYDPEGFVLAYSWTMVAKPQRGQAALVDERTVMAGLAPDVAGTWAIRLTVTDKQGAQAADLVLVEVVDRPCTTDTDCDDHNPCTSDRCESRQCSYAMANGSACDDGLFCTELDVCTDGECAGVERNCVPGVNQCNRGFCNEEQDRCQLVPVLDGSACDDGRWCTIGDICLSGLCEGAPRDCADVADQCQTGICVEEQGQCVAQPADDGTACDDGQWCTVDDACSGGACQAGTPRDCSDHEQACREGICNEATDMCVGKPRDPDWPCDDGVFCNGIDTCDGQGNCRTHTGNPCADGPECNQHCQELARTCFNAAGDACGDPATSSCDLPDACDGAGNCLAMHLDGDCNDGLFCTVSDTCSNGVCTGLPRDCPQVPAGECQIAICSENAQGCTTEAVADGTPCSDGLYCTADDSCQSGECVAGPPRDCDDSDDCTVDDCNETQGACTNFLAGGTGSESLASGNCSNGIDDDCDGLIDEQDPDCTCTPNCYLRECGSDGCGGECGPGCTVFEHCNLLGFCSISPGGLWAPIEAGSFMMGSPPDESGRGVHEEQHQVTLTNNFIMQATEVTREQFETLTGSLPGNSDCDEDDCPVSGVSWWRAAMYTNALSLAAGRDTCYYCRNVHGNMLCSLRAEYADPYQCPGYRLPTEAEWEYAARAGTTTSTYNGELELLGCDSPNPVIDSIAWFCGNSGYQRIREVGLLEPNAFGLVDMLGNLAEWCHDQYADDYGGIVNNGSTVDPFVNPGDGCQVIRGGAGSYAAQFCRSATRLPQYHGETQSWLGFRPVRSLLP